MSFGKASCAPSQKGTIVASGLRGGNCNVEYKAKQNAAHCDLCVVGVLATSAFAQPQTVDKKVYFTFSGPVEIPGATLPAGKYLFHLADPDSGRQVLQVQSADGKKVYGMFFSMPAQRPRLPKKPKCDSWKPRQDLRRSSARCGMPASARVAN